MWHLFRRLGSLLHSWWQRERIRVSPTDGRLLGLTPGCVVIIDGTPAQVVARERGPPAGEPRVIYVCRTRAGTAILQVRRRQGERGCQVRWRESDFVRDLTEDDIEVLPSGGV